MADDSTNVDSSPLAFIAWPTLVTILVTVVTWVASVTELKTSRPPNVPTGAGPDSTDDIKAVYSRLWDDPFSFQYSPKSSGSESGSTMPDPIVHPLGPRDTPWGRASGRDVVWLITSGLFLLTCAAFFERRTRHAIVFLTSPVTYVADALIWGVATFLSRSLQRGGGPDSLSGPLGSLKSLCQAISVAVYRRIQWSVTVNMLLALAADGAILVLIFVIRASHLAADGEPFSLTEGISVWPSVILRVAVLMLGTTFLILHPCRVWEARRRDAVHRDEDSAHARPRLSDRLQFAWRLRSSARLSLPQRLFPLSVLSDNLGARRSEGVWKRYESLASSPVQIARVLLLTTLYLGFGTFLFKVLGFPNLPYRGAACGWWSFVITQGAVVLLIASIMYVLDVTNLAVFLVRNLGRCTPRDAEAGLRSDGRAHDPAQAFEWRIIRDVAAHTKLVGNAFWWPCGLILLMTVSRLRFFDCWDFSWSLISLVSINISAAVVSAIILRRETTKVRANIVARLRRQAQLAKADGDMPAANWYATLIENIEAVRDGAFSSWKRDPVLWALSLPFASAAGLTLVQQFLLS